MKKMINVLPYLFSRFAKSNKYLIPLFLTVALLLAQYLITPVYLVDSYLFSFIYVYFIMAWVGFSLPNLKETVSEQLILLRTGSAAYYLAEALFLFLLGCLLSFLVIGFPLLENLFVPVYTQPFTLSEIVLSYMLCCLVAWCGSSLGAFFHPRLFPERKPAMTLALFYALAGLVKFGLNNRFPAAKFFTWLFPPLSDVILLHSASQTYAALPTALSVCYLSIFCLLFTTGKILLLRKKGF